MTEDSIQLQEKLEAAFGTPEQILGSKTGALTLRFPYRNLDVLEAVRQSGAKVLSSGMTPTRVGGPAIVPNVVARAGSVTVIVRGRVEQDALRGLDVIIAEPNLIGSANAQAIFAFLLETIEGMPDPEEAFLGLLYHVLDTKFEESPQAGRLLLGRMLSGLGQYLEQRAD